MAEVGDKVKITTKKDSEEGILMPSHEKDVVILKLSNGYNIGFEKKEIKNIAVVKKKKSSSVSVKKITSKKGLPTITILNCGGTIASKVDYETGGVVAKFTAEDLLEMFPEIRKIANIKAVTVAQMMSEDMMFSDYQKIAAAIKKEKTDGIILTQGTDTLGYTAAALSFMLEEINIPVLVVGSQRSTDRGSSDAFQNLICAAQFIADSKFIGVGVCMHSSSEGGKCAILPGARTRKMHTSRRDAFKAINGLPIAIVDLKSGKIEFKDNKYSKNDESKLVVKDKFEKKVGLLKTHIHMNPKLFEFYADNYKGIIIEGTGLGHAPTNLGKDNLKNYEILKKFIQKGGVVGITSQCLFGRVNPNVYTNLRRLSEIGCVFCEDMIPETAFIKLGWLLGNYPKEAKELLAHNLRGEISKKLAYEKDFLK